MTRIASGAALALGFLALVLFGTPLHFFIFVEAAVVICVYEFYWMFAAAGTPGARLTGPVAAAGVAAVIYLGGGAPTLAAVLGLALVAVALEAMICCEDVAEAMTNTVFAILFTAPPLACLALLRGEPDGAGLVILIVTANALCDTFAYYTGRNFGKRPLAPKLSPKKTIEGFAGGVVGAVAGAVAVKLIMLPSLGPVHTVVAGLIAGLIGPVGDLAESSVKRKTGVKDSGGFIPGHGGVLDRLDSLLFTSAVFYAYFHFVAGS